MERGRGYKVIRDYYVVVGLQLGHTIRKHTLGSSWAAASYMVLLSSFGKEREALSLPVLPFSD